MSMYGNNTIRFRRKDKPPKNKKESLPKGVAMAKSYATGDKKYQAHIRIASDKNTLIGCFKSIREAKVAYDYCLKHNKVINFKKYDILEAEIDLMLDGKSYEYCEDYEEK